MPPINPTSRADSVSGYLSYLEKPDTGYGTKHRIGTWLCGYDVGFVRLKKREIEDSTN
jgi:hypothetical protein